MLPGDSFEGFPSTRRVAQLSVAARCLHQRQSRRWAVRVIVGILDIVASCTSQVALGLATRRQPGAGRKDESIEIGMRVAVALRGVDKIAYVRYASEYFEFLKAHPKAGRILALGPRVTFLWEGKLVRIEVKQG